MSNNDGKSFPESTNKDKIIQYGKPAAAAAGVAGSFLTGIPGLSILATELYSRVVIPSLDQRRIEWLNDIANRLKKLEDDVSGFNAENMTDNQLFITILTQATQIVIRNHQKEKLDALRNSVLNSALKIDVDEDEMLIFLNYIDIFTRWHLRVLKFMEIKSVSVAYDPNNLPEDIICLTGGILEKEFPELRGRADFYTQIINDLAERDLITDGARKVVLSWKDDGSKMYGDHLTPKGRRFIKYFSNNSGLKNSASENYQKTTT